MGNCDAGRDREGFNQIVNESTVANGRMQYISFGSCEGLSRFRVAELLNRGQNLHDKFISALDEMKYSDRRFRVEQQVVFSMAKVHPANRSADHLVDVVGDILHSMTRDTSSWHLRVVSIKILHGVLSDLVKLLGSCSGIWAYVLLISHAYLLVYTTIDDTCVRVRFAPTPLGRSGLGQAPEKFWIARHIQTVSDLSLPRLSFPRQMDT
ncbi:hypothetical protein V1525DRAFT_198952 [Lipomyces kononenkoae]|uniref:Uncharacterized protein n=1 Tax=Lipomyces kononenkoae TaxID=34357 RepID=A0ACC3SY99_LIPKO